MPIITEVRRTTTFRDAMRLLLEVGLNSYDISESEIDRLYEKWHRSVLDKVEHRGYTKIFVDAEMLVEIGDFADGIHIFVDEGGGRKSAFKYLFEDEKSYEMCNLLLDVVEPTSNRNHLTAAWLFGFGDSFFVIKNGSRREELHFSYVLESAFDEVGVIDLVTNSKDAESSVNI